MEPTEIFSIDSAAGFNNIAMKLYREQYEGVPVYREFCDHLRRDPAKVHTLHEIPFLPVSFFKTHRIIREGETADLTFSSSGTTGSIPGRHFVAKARLYEKSFLTAFERRYGAVTSWNILALLPSYQERGGSSLIHMVDTLIKKSERPYSGFFLNDTESLIERLRFLESREEKSLLIGVSYALLDLVKGNRFSLKHTTVMETGGMKGRRKELVRDALHHKLKKGFGVSRIHSEYGMTELLSQAYSSGAGRFVCPPWMRILIRDPEDPFSMVQQRSGGGINVIDLANWYSCAFLSTQDLGKVYPDGSFEVLGRFDASDIRGCNLMVV